MQELANQVNIEHAAVKWEKCAKSFWQECKIADEEVHVVWNEQ